MKNRLRSKVAIWLRSWRTTFRELKHFVERYFKFVLATLAITYSLIWGGMYLQYQIVKGKDGSKSLSCQLSVLIKLNSSQSQAMETAKQTPQGN